MKTINSVSFAPTGSSIWGQSASNQQYFNNKQQKQTNSTTNSWLSKPSSSHLPPKFGGLNMGDVLKVTIAQEMSKVGMGSYKAIDLTQKGLNLSTKKDRAF